MDASPSNCSRLLVAAFDFGTTYSGYAFSFRDKPLEIKYNPSWVAGSEKLISMKTPTCVLLKPNKEFHSFGFEAENMYSELAEDNEHHEWYLFRRFKMMLYDTQNIHMDATVEDISGKKMPALTIFSNAIRYLNNHLLNTLDNQTDGIQSDDIQYIINVPAIWDQKAKQFMRKAANEAGIKDDQLRIALEPEAASIILWCQVATDHKLSGLAGAGSTYMVVDIGGGTADITVHEKMMDGTLKEIHKASGGCRGGVQVDKAYEEMLSKVFGFDAFQKFKKEHVGDYFDLMRDFETKKRTISPKSEGKMTFKMHLTLKDCAETGTMTMVDLIEKSPLKGKIKWTFDKIRVEKDLARSLFDTVIDELTKHVEDLLSNPITSEIDAVLLVGGFGECEVIKDAFAKKFANKKLMIPSEAGLAILKGSVRFGHLPDIVSVRVGRFTYGWSTCPLFDERIHDKTKKIYFEEARCRDVFRVLVKIGEDIPIGREVKTSGKPASIAQINSFIDIYSSTHEHPMYVTDEGCTLLGRITVELPDSDKIEDKMCDVFLIFGGTELKCRVVLRKTNTTYETTINCLA